MRDSIEIKEGNRFINLFLDGIPIKSMAESFSTEPYNESWDLLMMAIRKVKQCVFDEGYDIFMPEHSSYIAIGNACYDADLTGAWLAVLRWIILREDIQNTVNINNEYIAQENASIVFRSRINNGISIIRISPHLIRRWKQRISQTTTVEEICETVCNKEINKAYLKHGDGKYYLGDGLVVTIQGCKAITIYKSQFDEIYKNTKVLDLSEKRWAGHEIRTSSIDFINKYRKNA